MRVEYSQDEPSRQDIDALPGATLLEFGSPYCGHCRRAAPLIEAVTAARPGLRHLKVFDGRGQPLGRSFGVKLWPTLMVLRDGRELARVVRPQSGAEIERALAALGADRDGEG